jgi:hypothetical protein
VERIQRVCDQLLDADIPNQSPVRSPSPTKKHGYMNKWTERQIKVLKRIEQIETKLELFDQRQIIDVIIQSSPRDSKIVIDQSQTSFGAL